VTFFVVRAENSQKSSQVSKMEKKGGRKVFLGWVVIPTDGWWGNIPLTRSIPLWTIQINNILSWELGIIMGQWARIIFINNIYKKLRMRLVEWFPNSASRLYLFSMINSPTFNCVLICFRLKEFWSKMNNKLWHLFQHCYFLLIR
jgi:hypothetical protein